MCVSCRKSIIVRHNAYIFFGGEDDCSVEYMQTHSKELIVTLNSLVRN